MISGQEIGLSDKLQSTSNPLEQTEKAHIFYIAEFDTRDDRVFGICTTVKTIISWHFFFLETGNRRPDNSICSRSQMLPQTLNTLTVKNGFPFFFPKSNKYSSVRL